MKHYKKVLVLLGLFCCLSNFALAYTYTPNYNLQLPQRGEQWLTPWNANFSTIDNLLAQAAKVYEMTGTFNGPTGRALTLPVAVDAVTDYTIAITPNPKATGAVGDVSVVQGTTTFTVYCSQANTTDTFEASVIYVGSSAAFTDSTAQVCMVTTEAEMISTDASTTSCAMWFLSGSFTLTAARTITKPMIPLKGFEITTTAANTLTFSTGYVYGKPRHQVFVASPGEVLGLHYANPDMFGAAADWNGTTGTNDYNAIQCALSSGAQNVEVMTGQAYAYSTALSITQDGQRFYAESRATTENSTNGGKLVWTGAAATNMLIIGSAGAAVATSPIQIENIYFDGQDTCLYAIYSNRMNALSEIRGCFFYRTPGFIKALDCWYLTLEDLHMYGVATANQGATPLALSTAYADLDDGSLILNAANRVNVNRVAISHMNITIDGTRQSYIINSNRQENLKFGMFSTEDVHPEDAVIYLDNSSQGENVTIDHWYLENVDGTALVALGPYAKQGIDINNIHLYQAHIGNIVRAGSTSSGPNVRVRRLEFVDFVSMTKVFYAANANYANFVLEDSFIAPGYKVYDTDHYVIKPYGGETVTNSAGYIYTTKDNRLGLTTTGTRRDVSNYGFSNIGSGFATTYSGTESRNFGAGAITVPYIDLAYDGYNIVVNGEPMFLSKRYVEYYRVRFYPTENGASTDWEMRLGRLGQLWIEEVGTTTNNAGSTPVLQFNVTAADEVDAGSIDTTVRRPPGLPLNYNPGNMLVANADPSSAPGNYEYKVGDRWLFNAPTSASIKGKECITAGNPGTWKAFGPSSGATADRPTLTSDDSGYVYYDTDLDQSVVWSGAAWIAHSGGACVPIGDFSAAIGTGTKWSVAFKVPYKHTLTKISLTTNEVAGSITIDVWSDAPGATTGLAALTDADSLFDTATEPAIADASADNYFEVVAFDAGEAAGAAGDYYVVNVDAAATITGASVCFDFTRTD